MAYAVINTDSMSATKDASKHVHFRITNTALENGSVVKIGSLVTGERQLYTYSTPEVSTPLTSIAILVTPELVADERKKALSDFRNEVGDEALGFMLEKGDVFTITAEGLTGTSIAVGNVVELQADTKLKVVATATSGSTKVGSVIAIENGKYRIRVGD
jgi:hypothetical protein